MIKRSARFEHEKFRKLLMMAIVMYDLSFQFDEYAEIIRNLFTYIYANIKEHC